MSRTEAFRVEGVIIEALANQTYRVELVNGHQLTGFVIGKAKATARFLAGDRVKLQLTPYDLSSGRILVGAK